MQKKLIALAMASAFATPAFAATSNVDIYGILNMSVNYVKSDVAGANKSISLVSNASRLGLKGSEDLGDGLAAIWQIESDIQPDNGTGTLAKRNTFVGLKGGFGAVIAGTHDTPMKLLGRSVDVFGDGMGDSRNLLGADYVTGKSDFDLRPTNVIAYLSPNFGGVSAIVAYVTSHGLATAGTCSAGLDCNKDDAFSGLVKYDSDMFMVGAGYEKHNVVPASNLSTSRNIWRVVGSVNLGDFKLGGQYDKQSNDSNWTTVTTNAAVKRDGYGVFGSYKLGNTTLKADYIKAGKISGVANSEAKQYTLGADYSLSKRSTVYAFYAKVDNSSAAGYGLGAGGGDSNTTVGNLGTSPSVLAVGLKHVF